MAAITWLSAIEEPVDDVLSIRGPPVRSSPRRCRVQGSRRLLLGLGLSGVCSSLAAILALIATGAG